MYHDSITRKVRMEGLGAAEKGWKLEIKRVWREDILIHSIFYTLTSIVGILGVVWAGLMALSKK